MEPDIQDKISQFFSQGQRYDYAPGAVIVEAGQDPPGVMWLSQGIVEEYALTREGVKVGVNVFKPPAFFPMSWVINRTPNDYFFAAASEVTLHICPADEALNFIKAHPEIVFDLLSRVYRGTDGLLQRLTLADSKNAKDRLIFELITEGYRFGQQIDQTCWRIKATQSTLAARSGLARETVSRELHKLADEGMVALDKGTMTIDLEKLQSLLRNKP